MNAAVCLPKRPGLRRSKSAMARASLATFDRAPRRGRIIARERCWS